MLPLSLLSPALAATCAAYDTPALLAESDTVPCDESSGLAASRTQPGVYFTHDDSGGLPEIFAFDATGAWLGTWRLEGASLVDWEDMAAGPCPDGNGDCLYIGDIGDNFHFRPFITIWVVAEPDDALDAEAPVEGTLPVLATARLTWPDVVRDAESRLVHPLTGRVYVVSKEADGDSIIAAADASVLVPPQEDSDPDPVAMTFVADLDLTQPAIGDPMTTGADWERAGDRVVIRTYGAAWEWETDPCDPDSHWNSAPMGLGLAGDRQGEAIAYSLDGDLVTTSEGTPLSIRTLTCTAPGPGADACPEDTDTGQADSAARASGCRGCAASALLLPFLGAPRRRRASSAGRGRG